MKLNFWNPFKQGMNFGNRGLFFNRFDPSGMYTGNYLNSYGEYDDPEQDADDL